MITAVSVRTPLGTVPHDQPSTPSPISVHNTSLTRTPQTSPQTYISPQEHRRLSQQLELKTKEAQSMVDRIRLLEEETSLLRQQLNLREEKNTSLQKQVDKLTVFILIAMYISYIIDGSRSKGGYTRSACMSPVSRI